MQKKTEQFPVDSVVYFIKRDRGLPRVEFGTVDECFPSVVNIQLYDFPDLRLVEGVPVRDFETPTKWRKLPEFWGYQCCLFEYTYAEPPAPREKYHIDKPEEIRQAIDDGVYVRVQDNCYTKLDTEIDKNHGWRIVRRITPMEYHPAYIALSYHDVYKTYEEASAIVQDFIYECVRMMGLSDRDWAFEQAQKVVRRYADMYGLTDEQVARYYDKISEIDDIEKLDFRICDGSIQFKYEDKKRWSSILLD